MNKFIFIGLILFSFLGFSKPFIVIATKEDIAKACLIEYRKGIDKCKEREDKVRCNVSRRNALESCTNQKEKEDICKAAVVMAIFRCNEDGYMSFNHEKLRSDKTKCKIRVTCGNKKED